MNTSTLIILVIAIAMLTLGSVIFRKQYRASQQTDNVDQRARLLSLTMASGAALFALVTIFYATGLI